MQQNQISEFQQGGILAGQFLRENGDRMLQPGFDGAVTSHASMSGFTCVTKPRGPQRNAHEARVMEAARLFRDVLSGQTNPFFFQQAMAPTEDMAVAWLQENYPGIFPANLRRGQYSLREVMSVTDYQALFLDVIDRSYFGYYSAYPIVSLPLVKQHDLRDFRARSIYMLDSLVTPFTAEDAAGPAAQQALTGPVPQGGAVLATASTGPVNYQPTLYQSRASVNWRAMVNDDLGIFRDIAARLAIVANRGIDIFLTKFFFGAAGLNANLFKAGYTNLITTAYGAASNNPALSQQGIQDGFKVLAAMKDSSNQPILMSGTPILVYGPSYTAVAENLKGSMRSFVQVEGGTSNAQGFPAQLVEATNWAMQNMKLVMNPYMPQVMSGAAGNIAQTAWAIVMDPNAQNRPCVEVGFLNGFKTPQMFRRAGNTMSMGGGIVETMGNFDTNDSDTKIVSVFGGTVVDGRSCVGSNGSGS
jgi:hypothetical protein